MRRIPTRLFLALSLVVPLVAAAEDKPRYRLAFTRDPAAASCPDAAGLRAAVAAKLGYDPFTDDATRTLAVSFGKSGPELRAQIELRDEGGAVTGARKLKSTATTCGPLAEDVAQAIAIVVDPLYLNPPPPPSASASASASTSAAPTAAPTATVDVPEPPEPPVPTEPTRVFVTGASFVTAGSSPAGLGGGFALGLGVRPTKRWSVGLEGRYDLEGALGSRFGGEVRGHLLVGNLVPCLHEGPFLACAVGQLGAFLGASAGIDDPQRMSTLYLAAGVRLGVEVPLVGSALALRLGLDVLASLTHTRLVLHGEEVWVSSPVTGTLGGGLVGWFFP